MPLEREGFNSASELNAFSSKPNSNLDCISAAPLSSVSYTQVHSPGSVFAYPIHSSSVQHVAGIPTTESHFNIVAHDNCTIQTSDSSPDTAANHTPLLTPIQPFATPFAHMNQLVAASCSPLGLSCNSIPDLNTSGSSITGRPAGCGPHDLSPLFHSGGLSQLVSLSPAPMNAPSSDLQTGTHLSIPFAVPSRLELFSVPGEPIPAQSIVAPEVNSSQTDLAPANSGMVVRSTQSEYYVMVHVDAGATFSVRVGDQIQHIPGPATVRMVSNSGPPIPMPMQVPAGHLVQQIVDEEGILKHVILSLYPDPTVTSETPLAPIQSPQVNGVVPSGPGIHHPAPHLHHIASPHHAQYYHHHHHHPFHQHHVPLSHHSASGIPNHLRFNGPVSLGLYTDLNSPPSTGNHFYAPSAQLTSISHAQTAINFPTPLGPSHIDHSQQLICPITSSQILSNGIQTNSQTPAEHFESPILTDSTIVVTTTCDASVNPSSFRGPVCPGLPEQVNGLSEPSYQRDRDVLSDTAAYVAQNSMNASTDGFVPQTSSSGCRLNDTSERSAAHDCILPDVSPPTTDHVVNLSTTQSPKRTNRLKQWSEGPSDDKDSTLLSTSGCEAMVCQSEQLVATEKSADSHSDTTATVTKGEGNTSQSAATWWHAVSSENNQLPTNPPVNEPTDTRGTTLVVTGNSSYRRRNRTNAAKAYVASRPTQSQKACSSVKPQTAYSTIANGSVISTSSSSPVVPETPSFNHTSPDHISSIVCTGNSPNGNSRISTKLLQFQTPLLTYDQGYCVHPPHANFLLNNPPASPETNYDAPSSADSEIGAHESCCSHVQHNIMRMPNTNGISVRRVTAPTTAVTTTNSPHKQWKNDVEYEAIQACLSTIGPLEVSNVKAFSALIHLAFPSDLTVTTEQHDKSVSKIKQRCTESTDSNTNETVKKIASSDSQTSWKLNEQAIQFELYLAERDCTTPFSCIFVGGVRDIALQDLRAASDYYVKYCCVFSDIRGRFSDVVHFTTSSTVPSAPRNVTVIGHTRTTIHLKWSAASDHGSRITSYCVEYAPASPNHQHSSTNWISPQTDVSSTAITDRTPRYVSGFQGLAKTCNLTQLSPSTEYFIRVLAKNAHGDGPWSSVVTACTAGNPPTTPPTPFLLAVDVHTLTLAWHQPEQLKRSPTNSRGQISGLSYTLEMDDETMGHGFVTVFDGTGTETRVENLRRNTRYRFRLAASNVDGRSSWTDVVSFSTLPDRPSAPRNLSLVGSVQPARLTLSWDVPEDDGGLPICAYRLEAQLPYYPPLNPTDDTHPKQSDTEGSVCNGGSLLCWPHATEPSPDSVETQASAGACLKDLQITTTQSNFVPGICRLAWFTVYEGAGQTVTLERLLPGLNLAFRVRARSATVPDAHSRFSEDDVPWGPAGPPLEVSLPPIPPAVPASPRIVGQPKPTSLHLTWKSPKHTGGASIRAYEVWQVSMGCSWQGSEDSDSDSPSQPYLPSTLPCTTSDSEEHLCDPDPASQTFTSVMVLKRCFSLDSGISKLPECPRYSSSPMCHYSRPCSRGGHLVCVVPAAECLVRNLRPGHSYGFRVRACNLVGWGAWSRWAILSTAASPPSAPSGPPRLLPHSSTSVSIFWDPVTRTNGSKIKEYWVEWQSVSAELPYDPSASSSQVESQSSTPSTSPKHSKPDDFQLLYTGPALSYQLDGVQPASCLAFRYCAVNEAGPGPWSPIGTCVIPSAPPGQPYGLRVSDCLPNAARIHWYIPQHNGTTITSYTLEISKCIKDKESTSAACPSSVRTFDIPAPPATFLYPSGLNRGKSEYKHLELATLKQLTTPVVDYLFNDLDSDFSYNVRVRALNALGYGPFSAPFLFSTPVPPPNPPVFGAPTHLTATSVRLQWQPADDALTVIDGSRRSGIRAKTSSTNLRFTLQLNREPDCEWSTVYEGPDTVYKVTRLVENSTYYLRVRAENLTGPSDFSEPLLIKTPRFPPPAVRGLKLVDTQTDTCHLEWTPITHPWTDPVVYVVHLFPSAQYSAAQSTSTNVLHQVYRGSQTNCRLSGLTANTEFLVRVCAVRLCLPSDLPLRRTSTPSPSNTTRPYEYDPQSSEWFRETLDESSYPVAELSGPFSHFLAFSTKPAKSPKLTEESSNPTLSTGLRARWHILSNMRFPFWSMFTTSSPTPDDPIAVSSSTLVHSSRRKTVTHPPFTPVLQAPSPASLSQSTHKQFQVGTSHFKRSQRWSHLSDRKLALFFLLLFAVATVLVSVSLQQLLTAPSTSVTSGLDANQPGASPTTSDIP